MVNFECQWCGYKFNLSTKEPPGKCPYCDRSGGISEPKTAQDLIDEADA